MLKLLDQNLLSTKNGHNYWKYSIYSDALSKHIEWIIESIKNSKDDRVRVGPKHWNDLFHILKLENCPILKTRS
jgi:hypothetical protein